MKRDLDAEIAIVFQPRNFGKGAAVARDIREATGDLVLVQDAVSPIFREPGPLTTSSPRPTRGASHHHFSLPVEGAGLR